MLSWNAYDADHPFKTSIKININIFLTNKTYLVSTNANALPPRALFKKHLSIVQYIADPLPAPLQNLPSPPRPRKADLHSQTKRRSTMHSLQDPLHRSANGMDRMVEMQRSQRRGMGKRRACAIFAKGVSNSLGLSLHF